jgi:sporulation protein YlmC with PRC-barrel domain
MDIPINVTVECVDGTAGRSSAIILNPANDQVTHLVVREEELFDIERLVPVELVEESTPQRIRLRCTKDELATMQPFISTEFVPMPPGFGPYPGEGAMLWPYVGLDPEVATIEHENIPPHEVAVHRGARVHASDGAIGRVDELLVNPANNHVSHLVLREGHLWGQKDVTIPIAEIDRIDEDAVYLKLSKHQVGALPAIPVRRRTT